jgi:hypothetical protein
MATPDAIRIGPELPAEVVPVLNRRAPDTPADNAFPVRTKTSPDEDETPTPDTILTSPPDALGSNVLPAEMKATDPAPLSVPPTTMLIEPPLPALAEPVNVRMFPDAPLAAAPVANTTGPEDPASGAFCDRILNEPLLLRVDSPVSKSTAPPVAMVVVMPARTTT